MTTLENPTILTRSRPSGSKTVPGEQFQCSRCGSVGLCFTPGSCGSNYAVLPDRSLLCVPCADLAQREELKDRSKPFTCYISGDGKRATTWTGGTLGTVTGSKLKHLARWSYDFGKTKTAYTIRDVHGALWKGDGAPGMFINMKPSTPNPSPLWLT